MKSLELLWGKMEEIMIALSLALMTLITFVYVLFNNLYSPFYDLADAYPSLESLFLPIADFSITVAQEMTWSVALTKLFFAMLIFFGASYGVRTAGHIGIDAVVKKFNTPIQRRISIVACLACLIYAAMIGYASIEWVSAMFKAQIGAEDLQHFGIQLWHIGLIIPIGYLMVFMRFAEIFIRLLKGQQSDLGLADEAKDAMKLQEENH
ncbi:C4-dicarboxylate transporter, DctQ subunit [Pasteurella testudinis DSM 23072]|uniref:TRAP transporter small permease protein n=1 Tax=Pasteurella testudinis DSM 23072 TaxID=1122938 RepID=A0A1W1UCA6_9PAST|nr:TRAP transporter small permease [Pasteurella testudinis]SMB78699.1 C4-dicarboxylate transporter, DctQ subunit [Pasteurella testudinis DSM 23072]SUB52512.1 putative tripartite ATP-independent periplasmic transporter DctQ component [Pasteurella testudinis]